METGRPAELELVEMSAAPQRWSNCFLRALEASGKRAVIDSNLVSYSPPFRNGRAAPPSLGSSVA